MISEVKLLLNGDHFMSDNGEVTTRVINILQKAQLDMDTKNKIISIIQNAELCLKRKLALLNFECAKGIDFTELIEAIQEQLLLTEC